MIIIIFAIISFFISGLFGYIVHWSLHQTWSGNLNKKHMTHHLILYPASDYTSEQYRNAGKDNSVITFGLLALPLIAFPIILGVIGILPLSIVFTILIVMGIMGFLHNYLHDVFHIKNHFLNKIPVIKHIFTRWNYLHYLHHVNMKTNYGIFLFHWDKLFKTYYGKRSI